MTLPVPAPVSPPVTRERLGHLLERALPGVKLAGARERILGWADSYAAHMIETYARPDDRWGPQ